MKIREKIDKASAWDVLVVDADPSVADLVKKAAGELVQQVRVATSIDAAEIEMKKHPADVLLVNLQINDNGGMELIRELRRKYPRTDTIALSRVKKTDICLDAWRAGAADLIVAPIHVQDVRRSFSELSGRRTQVKQLAQRNQRLRSVCKQLNRARHDISQQVDLLCNDLVRAYQDLAQQLNMSQLAADYSHLVDDELDIESLLRKTMEWVLKKLGPVNAAVYLPDSEHRFALGAYLNLDTAADADLIETMGETIVAQAQSSGAGVFVVEDDRMLEQLFGEQAEVLTGRVWLAVACRTKRECLAVLVIFRKQERGGGEAGEGSQVDASMRGVVEAIAPVLGERIQQALSFYHRLHPRHDTDDEDEYGEAQA